MTDEQKCIPIDGSPSREAWEVFEKYYPEIAHGCLMMMRQGQTPESIANNPRVGIDGQARMVLLSALRFGLAFVLVNNASN